MSEAAARILVVQLLRLIRVGTLVVTENGRTTRFGSGAPTATLEVRSPRLWGALLRGSRGLADAYGDGWVDSPDLVALIRLAAVNAFVIDRFRRPMAPVRAPMQRLRAALRPVTRQRSRQDIAAHYDLGNELFELMLDPTMSYSCAVFEHPEMTLEDAQVTKLERICERLELGPADHLLEIGTGWGALAIHAAQTRGCRVTTTTISAEQYRYARALVALTGLGDRVTVLMQDYRDLTGRFDKLVSVEMIEAVGWQHLGRFLAKCSRLLTADGLMLLQAITIDDRGYEVEKASRSFINTLIFPGGSLPSLAAIATNMARHTDLQLVRLDDLTVHYVETLKRWRKAFTANAKVLAGRGYDERFQRIWTLYLSYCEAGFAERRICDQQLLLAKPGYRTALPSTQQASRVLRALMGQIDP
jgi:cyclopropane-fatty-acyl-phospholipid synthase